MPDRRRQIELLIGSRFDLLWFPGGALRTTGGLAPGAKKPCPDCGHQDEPGWRTDKFKHRAPCGTCGGRTMPRESGQWRKTDRGRGFVFVDSMDALHVPVGDAETKASARPRKTVMCDACAGEGATTKGRCDRCLGTGRRDQHVFDLQLDTSGERTGADPIDVAIDRRDEQGSWHQLELAYVRVIHTVNKPIRFAALTVNATEALRLLDRLYLHHECELHELGAFEQALVELAMAYIETQMPDPILVPRDVVLNARQQQQALKGSALNALGRERRDKQIRQWDRQGKPRQWIGQQTGLSDRQLREIINGGSVAA